MTSFVLVHGAFSDGDYWAEVPGLLRDAGHEVHVAELPSTGPEPAGLGGLSEDVGEVRRLVAEAAEPVVLVGHSYGGVVITELADDPRVGHSVYLGALWPQRGQALMDLMTGPVDWVVPTADGSAVQVTDDVARAAEVICADLDPEQVPDWHRRLLLSSATAVGTPVAAPDRSHPTTYVVLEKDNAVPVDAQEATAGRADHVERLATSHSPQLVDPAGVAAVLSRVSV